MPSADLSLTDARRLALAAQGFDRPRPAGKITLDHIRRVIHRLGLVQLDYVNVLLPAHYQVLFSRLGPYDRPRLDELVYRRREFTEQWAHEASIVPMDCWPLLAHRRATHRVRPYPFEKIMARLPEYVAEVLKEVETRGPLLAEEVPSPDGEGPIPGAWSGSVSRATLEAHFGFGALAVAERVPGFARRYDLAERVIPAEHRQRVVSREEAGRELLLRAARAQGVATAADLADYFRMQVRDARPRLAELVDAGELRLVRVEGWREAAYLDPQAERAKKPASPALLCPFDPLIWYRPRAVRLFDFDYRFEIFVPAAKRKWGCYVLPFLLGDRLVARVDLKADRAGGRLLVLAAYREPHAKASEVSPALAAELRTLANWLGLESIHVEPRGNLARPLVEERISHR
jgi:uncharacterized protein YcaQ